MFKEKIATKEKTATKDKTTLAGAFLYELFQTGVYKRSQGRITRQATFVALAVTIALGAWSIYNGLMQSEPVLRWGLAGGVLLVGLWLSYRAVNFPKFADFLIAVEAEMNKVSWPSRPELVRSSIVVIFVVVSLAMILFGYDLVWSTLFRAIGVLKQ